MNMYRCYSNLCHRGSLLPLLCLWNIPKIEVTHRDWDSFVRVKQCFSSLGLGEIGRLFGQLFGLYMDVCISSIVIYGECSHVLLWFTASFTGSQRVSLLKQEEKSSRAEGYIWCRWCNLPCPGESKALVRAPLHWGLCGHLVPCWACLPPQLRLSTELSDGAVNFSTVVVNVPGNCELFRTHHWLIYTHYYIPIPISSIIPGLGHHFLSYLPLTLFSFSINHGLF